MVKSKKATIKSSCIKCGSKTYFFDIQTASNNSKYLKITQSQFLGEETSRRRDTFILFKEDAQDFQNSLKEMVDDLTS